MLSMNHLTIIAVIELFVISFIFLFYANNKNKKVNGLLSSIHDLKHKLKTMELTNIPRFKLVNDVPCVFKIVKVGDINLTDINSKQADGIINNISRTGLNLISDLDFPIQRKIIMEIQFQLENENFNIKGIIERKIEEINGNLNYEINFIEDRSNAKELQKLVVFMDKAEIGLYRKNRLANIN